MSTPTIAPPLQGNTIGSTAEGFIVAEWQDPGGSVNERRSTLGMMNLVCPRRHSARSGRRSRSRRLTLGPL
jgi:hypothetical protein